MSEQHRQNYAVCSACGTQAECNSQLVYPDNGWVLPFETFGYYGGFDDNIDVLFGERISRQWVLCHDCVVKFLNTFPRLAESLDNGLHPCSDDTPCCRFAWRATEGFGTNDGVVHTQSVGDDGQWRDDD